MYRFALKQLIEKQGLSQKNIAMALSISKQALSNKLNGRAHISIPEFKLLCQLLDEQSLLDILHEYINDPHTHT